MDRKQVRVRMERATGAAGLALLFVVLVLPWVRTPQTEAFIYWSSVGPSGIGRANVDGTGVNEQFIPVTHDPYSLVLNARHLYWTALGDEYFNVGSIARARLDGTRVDERFVRFVQASLAVDQKHVYLTGNSPILSPSPTLSGSIGRINLNGTGSGSEFIPSPGELLPRVDMTGVAVDEKHVYWSQADAVLGAGGGAGIGRADLDGSDVDYRFIPFSAEGPDPHAVVVDDAHLYWSDYRAKTIGRANLDGTGVDPDFIPLDTAPNDLAVDAAHLYWTPMADGYAGGAIGRVDLDGTNIEPRFIVPQARPTSVVVDGLIDMTRPNTTITRAAPDRSTDRKVELRFASSETNSTFECKLDTKQFRPCSSPKRLKDLKPGRHTFQVRATDAALNTDPTPAEDKFAVVG